jgi:hypothetical protein
MDLRTEGQRAVFIGTDQRWALLQIVLTQHRGGRQPHKHSSFVVRLAYRDSIGGQWIG